MRTDQASLADWARQLAEASRDAGQDAARRADPDAFEAALEAIRQLARNGGEFGADDVRALSRIPLLGSVTGSAFAAARKVGLIESVGFETSRSPSRHGGLQRTWRGVDAP